MIKVVLRPQARWIAALGLAAMLAAQSVAGADASGSYSAYHLQQRAAALQQCLEQELSSLQVESSVSRDGRIEDQIRITRWHSGSLASRASGRAPVAGCTTPVAAAGNHCEPDGGVRHTVSFTLTVGERHPSWSASESSSFEDSLIDKFTNLGSGIHVGDPRKLHVRSATHEDGAIALHVRISYGGSALSQRDLEEWLRLPKTALIAMELVDSANEGQVIAARKVVARLRPGFRGRQSSGVPEAWRERALGAVASAAREILVPLSCETPLLRVALNKGKLWLNATGVTGLMDGRELLLVPSAESSIGGTWPVARVRGDTFTGQAALELVSGDSGLCASGCRALPL